MPSRSAVTSRASPYLAVNYDERRIQVHVATVTACEIEMRIALVAFCLEDAPQCTIGNGCCQLRV